MVERFKLIGIWVNITMPKNASSVPFPFAVTLGHNLLPEERVGIFGEGCEMLEYAPAFRHYGSF